MKKPLKVNTESLSNIIAKAQEQLEKTQRAIPQENDRVFFSDKEGRHLDRIWDKLNEAVELMEDCQDSILAIDDSRRETVRS